MDVKQKLMLCLWRKYRKYVREEKAISLEIQHRLVIIDLDKTALKKIVRKERIVRKRMRKLNEIRTRVRFLKILKN